MSVTLVIKRNQNLGFCFQWVVTPLSEIEFKRSGNIRGEVTMDPRSCLACAENVVTMAHLGSGSKSIVEMLFESSTEESGLEV